PRRAGHPGEGSLEQQFAPVERPTVNNPPPPPPRHLPTPPTCGPRNQEGRSLPLEETCNERHAAVRQAHHRDRQDVHGSHRRGTRRGEGACQELKAAARRGPRAATADGEREVLAKLAELPAPDRALGERLHAIIKAAAPALSPRTWYGMPAYAKDGKVVCFFQAAQ